MGNLDQINTSPDRTQLTQSYKEFSQDNRYKQKSYLNFLNFLKTEKQGYHGYSASEIGNIFEDISTKYTLGEINNIETQSTSTFGRLRHYSKNIAATFILLTAGGVSSGLAKSPDIFGVPAIIGNGPAIQKAVDKGLSNCVSYEDVSQKLKEEVTTTDTERKTRQNLAISYALKNKTGYVDKKDGTPRELMNATELYNQLIAELAKNPNYIHPIAMLPQQKVVYDITFCLQQLGYEKNKIFDTKDYIYTNDLVIAIIQFQNDQGIRKDGIVGPETFYHFNKAIQENVTNPINIQIDITTDNTTTGDTIMGKQDTLIDNHPTIIKDQNTIIDTNSIDQHNMITPDTLKDEIVLDTNTVQTTLEKYFVGRELGFIDPTLSYINTNPDSAQTLIQKINIIDHNTDTPLDKKANLLAILEEYKIENILIMLDDKIQHHTQANDSITVDSLLDTKNKLLQNISFTTSEQEHTLIEDTTVTKENSSINHLTKKNLPKKGFKKFKTAIITIVGAEPDETSNFESVTRQNLIQHKVFPEYLDMSFDEFSSLTPDDFLALYNNNKAKRN